MQTRVLDLLPLGGKIIIKRMYAVHFVISHFSVRGPKKDDDDQMQLPNISHHHHHPSLLQLTSPTSTHNCVTS